MLIGEHERCRFLGCGPFQELFKRMAKFSFFFGQQRGTRFDYKIIICIVIGQDLNLTQTPTFGISKLLHLPDLKSMICIVKVTQGDAMSLCFEFTTLP